MVVYNSEETAMLYPLCFCVCMVLHMCGVCMFGQVHIHLYVHAYRGQRSRPDAFFNNSPLFFSLGKACLIIIVKFHNELLNT